MKERFGRIATFFLVFFAVLTGHAIAVDLYLKVTSPVEARLTVFRLDVLIVDVLSVADTSVDGFLGVRTDILFVLFWLIIVAPVTAIAIAQAVARSSSAPRVTARRQPAGTYSLPSFEDEDLRETGAHRPAMLAQSRPSGAQFGLDEKIAVAITATSPQSSPAMEPPVMVPPQPPAPVPAVVETVVVETPAETAPAAASDTQAVEKGPSVGERMSAAAGTVARVSGMALAAAGAGTTHAVREVRTRFVAWSLRRKEQATTKAQEKATRRPPPRPPQTTTPASAALPAPVMLEPLTELDEQLMRWHAIWVLTPEPQRTSIMRLEAADIFERLDPAAEQRITASFGLPGVNAVRSLKAAVEALAGPDEDDGGFPVAEDNFGVVTPLDPPVETGPVPPPRVVPLPQERVEDLDLFGGDEEGPTDPVVAPPAPVEAPPIPAEDDPFGDDGGDPWADIERMMDKAEPARSAEGAVEGNTISELEDLEAMFSGSAPRGTAAVNSTEVLAETVGLLRSLEAMLRQAVAQGDDDARSALWDQLVEAAGRLQQARLGLPAEQVRLFSRQLDRRGAWWLSDGVREMLAASGDEESRRAFEESLRSQG